MNRFASRSALPELIDSPGIPFKDWHRCLQELNTINTWLGGHRSTIEGLERVLLPGGPVKLFNGTKRFVLAGKTPAWGEEKPAPGGERTDITVVEIGCGGGDNLKAIHAWNRRRSLPIRYIGIDLNKACIDFAEENCRELPSSFIHADYRTVHFGDPPDIIFSSLFCHHFGDGQLVGMLKWLKLNTRIGFFINDLHRHPLAYHSISLLTRLLSRSYLVRNDAPVSVLRGFQRKEWLELLRRAGIERYQVSWRWAFRYLVSVRHV